MKTPAPISQSRRENAALVSASIEAKSIPAGTVAALIRARVFDSPCTVALRHGSCGPTSRDIGSRAWYSQCTHGSNTSVAVLPIDHSAIAAMGAAERPTRSTLINRAVDIMTGESTCRIVFFSWIGVKDLGYFPPFTQPQYGSEVLAACRSSDNRS